MLTYCKPLHARQLVANHSRHGDQREGKHYEACFYRFFFLPAWVI